MKHACAAGGASGTAVGDVAGVRAGVLRVRRGRARRAAHPAAQRHRLSHARLRTTRAQEPAANATCTFSYYQCL